MAGLSILFLGSSTFNRSPFDKTNAFTTRPYGRRNRFLPYVWYLSREIHLSRTINNNESRRLITETECPQLFQAIREVALETQCPMPKSIFITGCQYLRLL